MLVKLRRRLQQKSLEYFVGKQASARGQAQAIAAHFSQIIRDDFRDNRLRPLLGFPAKVLLNLADIYATVHPQAKKESFFPRLSMRNTCVAQPPPAVLSQIFIKTFRETEAHCLELSRSAAQHGMRIQAEAEIRLAHPVLQVVPRFLARTREIRNFI